MTVHPKAAPPGPGRAARVATRIGAGTVTVSVSGRLDQAGDAAVAEHLAEARRLCWGLLTVDLTGCEGLGEAALTAVREAGENAAAEGFRLSVAAGGPGIRAALDALSVRHTPAPATAGTPGVAVRVCVSRDCERRGDTAHPRHSYPFAEPGRPGQRLPSAV
ncbi:STAS domain-containing protein [Amycolatopsis saalfeldensis]|uniref:Anti-anti-sigma factor n=1 Tax=Amycolatopsis saalfeldensis TaxID=394193 RepID=A0A1H8UU99_9PSEU|nr:hypothetical protein [Amycolatopsis saalfeldensis]SEP06148.1 hypothetical protein SAMN04489732_103440 [Amycolatopsis saalfeldensis]